MPPPVQIYQASRPLEIITPLGENVLGLRSIHVQEQLSGGFTIEADLSSNDPDIKFDDIVGHPVGVKLKLPGGRQRYWHALVARFIMMENAGQFSHYRAILVPWLWALTRTADCRIFQELTYPEIVKKVFQDRGAKDLELRLSGTYRKSEYCVQYRETDFNFVSRLLEQEGIAYYFKHDKDKGLLVLADEKAAYDEVEGCADVPYRPGDLAAIKEAITSWNIEHEVQPTHYSLTDYNPLKPQVSLRSTANADRAYGLNDGRIFDYPGEYTEPADAERLARIRLDELQASAEIVRAQTTCLALGAGNLFTLKEHPRPEQNRQYLITSMMLSLDAGEFASGGKGDTHSSCSFTAVPSDQTYRPPRTTPKPVVHGPQPAVVVGPSGEEIYTDEHGRVKVSFYWDRESKADEKSSCWLRIAQGWAGKKWGAIYLPRIGHEVLVEFMEGDPDRPIVTGSVYNAGNAPPYPLPAEKTKSTLKSQSSKGGEGFNEIRFEDKKGEEQIFVHAEKNTDTRVKNDTYEWIGNDCHLIIKNDRVEEVGKDHQEKVANDHVEEVGRDHHLKIKGKEAIEITGSQSLKVSDDVTEEFAKNKSIKVTKDLYIKAENIVLEAATNLTLHVGDSFIAIEAGGIKIGTSGEIVVDAKKNISQKAAMALKGEAGTDVTLKAGTGLKLEGGATAEMKGPSTTVKGDAMVTIKGGIVKIN